jgi:hypothetical protein
MPGVGFGDSRIRRAGGPLTRSGREPGHWRAGCLETCTSGSEGGGRKRSREATSPAAYPTSVVQPDVTSLSQKGGSRATSLGQPAYPRPKGTGDHSMPGKREQIEIG